MAERARKKSTVKAKKVERAATRRKVKTRPRSKPATKKKAARRPRKARPDGIADKVASAFHTVVDTITETRALRNKMGPRGSEP